VVGVTKRRSIENTVLFASREYNFDLGSSFAGESQIFMNNQEKKRAKV
jgi:hypothetical protein